MVHSRLFLAPLVFLVGASINARGEKSRPEADPVVSFDVAPVPAWVRNVTPPAEGTVHQEAAGSYYLLLDRQIDVGRNALYWHEVRKITSENGVQAGASVSITFDPSIEKLTLHTIRVIRSGVPSNRIERSQLRFAPSEQDAQRRAYNRYHSAQTSLDDVRVGDLIEIAYTTEGADPARRGKYSELFSMQWEAPVGLNSFRLVYPSQRKLSFRLRNDETQPIASTDEGITEWSYQAINVPGRKIESDAPEDYNPKRQLHVSEFDSWAEVVEWALPLFEPNVADSAEFDEQVNKLKPIADPEQRILAALRFLQDEVRYLSADFYSGLRPATPLNEIVRRRFADAKDESLLLVALLRRTGIDAAPALVSPSYRSGLRDLLPSPSVFGHAIVQVQSGPNTYWLDPARAAQRGPLSQIYVSNDGLALVLRPDTKELTSFAAPQASWQSKKVIQHFRIWGPGHDAELDVISEYRGLAADRIRSSFQESTREEIQTRYLTFYAGDYPEVKVARLLWYEEVPGNNACRVTESYVIPNLWQLSDDKQRYRIFLRPDDIYSALGSTVSPQRRDPLSLHHPNAVTQEINVQMFQDWPFAAGPSTISTDFFEIRDEPSSHGALLQLNYTFESVKDRVESSEFQKFNEAINTAKNSLGYTLTYQTPEQLKNAQRYSLNWAVAAAALSFFATASFASYRYSRGSKLPEPLAPPAEVPRGLAGLGGWLILLAIGHVIGPFRFVKNAVDLWPVMFNTSSWRALTDPIETTYHPWWAPVLLYELFFVVAGFVYSLLLLVLFFGKRAAWPRCFFVFVIANLLLTVVDEYLVHRMPTGTRSLGASLRTLIPLAIGAAIWLPYVYRSRRVKATFRN